MLRHYASVSALCLGLALAPAALADYRAGMSAYERGNFGAAHREFREAAKAGDRDAQYMLGYMFEKGKGVAQNYVRAHAYYNMSAGLGRSDAAQARDILAQKMTADQIAEAQQRVDRWRRDRRGRDDASTSTERTTGAGTGVTVAAGLLPVYSVRNLQEGLNRLGYDAGSPDGIMGSKTRGAITQFQQAQGLSPNGQPSADLYDRVLSALSGSSGGSVRADVDRTPSSDTITQIQSELRQAGYDIDTVSGRLDEQTRQAIVDYQTDAGLTITGRADEQLLANLRSESGRRDLESRRTLVRSVQQELNDRGYDAGPADGAFGPKTRSAIRTFQSDAGLEITGKPTPRLLAALRSGTKTSAEAKVDATLVRDIQRALNERGYDAGTPDGEIGTQTRQAIREYQRNMGMATTGEPSVGLLASLQKSDKGEGRLSKSEVIDLKNALQARGYKVGPIDGTVDDQTREAIRAYQRDAGIGIDGRADQQLLAHVRTSEVRAGPATIGEAAGQLMQGVIKRMNEPSR